jgi:hypothetical protein
MDRSASIWLAKASSPTTTTAVSRVTGYANRGENYPVIDSAKDGDHLGNLAGSLTTTPGDHTVVSACATCVDDTIFPDGFDQANLRRRSCDETLGA